MLDTDIIEDEKVKGLYQVRCECGRWVRAKGPKPVKRPRCWLHRKGR